ncbi:leukocyte elastase inhibitor A-like [Dermacentor silvarum]|uniref:leukocyte elastase inhibitor A-like n=1 Tax=Dermacentor silvarum TaxID=543639 RepID=UPI001898A0C8|nr:leukocyte elastase inhibitor A-like [Dermacentor silvarum]
MEKGASQKAQQPSQKQQQQQTLAPASVQSCASSAKPMAPVQVADEPEQRQEHVVVSPEEVTALAPTITSALLAFTIELHQKLREVGGSKNVLFSPFLAAGALIALFHGARGRAARHLARLLHLHESDAPRAVAYFARCHDQLFASWPNHHRQGFNATHDLALIRDRNLNMLAAYVASLSPWCRTEPDFFEADMGSAVIRMDLWIRALTAFAFREYAVFEFPPSTGRDPVLLVSIAVLFVKGRWRQRFEPGFGDFHETPSKMRAVRVMRRRGKFRIGDCGDLDATALEIPYQDPSKTMVVFLPRMERLAAFEHSLTPAKLLRCLANLEEREVEVTMPVLRLKRHTELARIVSMLGTAEVFKSRGQLGGISDDKSLFVSTLTHVTVFHANARGGKGAPSTEPQTTTGSSPTSSTAAPEPVRFTVDRPFMFLVMNKDPDAVLVLGSVKRVSSRKNKAQSAN